MGRRSLYTEELATKLCSFLMAGATNADACAVAGISETAFYGWLRERDDFRARYDKAKAASRVRSIDIIAKSDDWRAHAWLLERQDPKHWGKTTEPDLEKLEKAFNEFVEDWDDGRSEVSGSSDGGPRELPQLPATTGT